MKEVKTKLFEKGDLVKGTDNGYTITNRSMTRAVVTNVDEQRGFMKVKVLEHTLPQEIGLTYTVRNNTDWFELLPAANNTAAEDYTLSITVTAEKGSNKVNAVVRYRSDVYDGLAECSTGDDFDFRLGAAIAIGRAFDLIDACEGNL